MNCIDYSRQLKTGIGWYWNHILHLMCLNQYEIQTQLTRLRILVYISYTLSASRCQAEPSTCARATGCVFKKRKMKNDRKCVNISTHVTQLGIGRQVGLTHLTIFFHVSTKNKTFEPIFPFDKWGRPQCFTMSSFAAVLSSVCPQCHTWSNTRTRTHTHTHKYTCIAMQLSLNSV